MGLWEANVWPTQWLMTEKRKRAFPPNSTREVNQPENVLLAQVNQFSADGLEIAGGILMIQNTEHKREELIARGEGGQNKKRTGIEKQRANGGVGADAFLEADLDTLRDPDHAKRPADLGVVGESFDLAASGEVFAVLMPQFLVVGGDDLETDQPRPCSLATLFVEGLAVAPLEDLLAEGLTKLFGSRLEELLGGRVDRSNSKVLRLRLSGNGLGGGEARPRFLSVEREQNPACQMA